MGPVAAAIGGQEVRIRISPIEEFSAMVERTHGTESWASREYACAGRSTRAATSTRISIEGWSAKAVAAAPRPAWPGSEGCSGWIS